MKGSLKVCSHQCDQCLFSPNRIVSPARMKEILSVCIAEDQHFECHKGTVVGVSLVCRGFFDNMSTLKIALGKAIERRGAKPFKYIDPDETLKNRIHKIRKKLNIMPINMTGRSHDTSLPIVISLSEAAKTEGGNLPDWLFNEVVQEYEANEEETMSLMMQSRSPRFTRHSGGWDVTNNDDEDDE